MSTFQEQGSPLTDETRGMSRTVLRHLTVTGIHVLEDRALLRESRRCRIWSAAGVSALRKSGHRRSLKIGHPSTIGRVISVQEW
ncbi:hypothetical protein ABZ552_31275, partial [Nocardia sp. NPDC019219]|uniref:hypothetical protein n=1 Tax=Nocardia sp. NPDC019219 TaxID=3154590 RepID=UPI003403FD32